MSMAILIPLAGGWLGRRGLRRGGGIAVALSGEGAGDAARFQPEVSENRGEKERFLVRLRSFSTTFHNKTPSSCDEQPLLRTLRKSKLATCAKALPIGSTQSIR
jgi:hypothetical protein